MGDSEEVKTHNLFSGLYLNPGNRGFARIRRGPYVDKSGLIGLINQGIDMGDKLICVSRPRRFGKSYAAKMLCAYYDRSCDSSNLFRGLQIEKDSSYSKYLNRLNVISLDITGFISAIKAAGRPLGGVVQVIREKLKGELLAAYPGIYGNDGSMLIPQVAAADESRGVCEQGTDNDDLSTGELLALISKQYGEQFFFIIDEWDALFRDPAADTEIQNEYMNFLRELFKNGNVTDQAIAGAYMTGILPIKKDGSESAISDFAEYTMLRPGSFYPYFGFTEEEAAALCRDNDLDYAEARRWYDGYTVKDGFSVYNPYSMMMAVKYGQFDSYWRQSSASDILADYIGMNYDGLSEAVASLIGGVPISVETGGFNNDIRSLQNKDDVLTLLIYYGYLTYDRESSTVRIPNEELRLEFSRSVREVKNTETLRRVKESDHLILDTVSEHADAVAEAIEKVHREETSPIFYNNEQALRSVIKLAYFSYRDHYVEMEELPSGTGYVDIAYLPKKGSALPALVIELKWNQSADTAISQIRRKRYPEKLQQFTPNILLVGISYDKDDPDKKHSCRIERA